MEKFVDINLKRGGFVGIQFVIWSGGYWINHNGANFVVSLKSVDSSSGKVSKKSLHHQWNNNVGMLLSLFFTTKHVYPPQLDVDGKYILKWLLDEISEREKEAERSLMHR